MLESRDTEDVIEWLKEYQNIKVVVRDGSIGYRAAIAAAHPQAMQINDRFHLVKNLVKAITKSLQRTISGRIKSIPTDLTVCLYALVIQFRLNLL
ncbi:transposase [Anaerovirgula multivorans]|uniref:transposase n=1 Tax=Anaerovirgula multivorans TaxID=312168 RepID=UPI001FA8E2FC|nr:transposase [Anaerovirgula multivorans]